MLYRSIPSIVYPDSNVVLERQSCSYNFRIWCLEVVHASIGSPGVVRLFWERREKMDVGLGKPVRYTRVGLPSFLPMNQNRTLLALFAGV